MSSTEARVAFVRMRATYDSWHFAEANRVGDTVWVSGQRGYDANDEISDDPAEQARVALDNLGLVLIDVLDGARDRAHTRAGHREGVGSCSAGEEERVRARLGIVV